MLFTTFAAAFSLFWQTDKPVCSLRCDCWWFFVICRKLLVKECETLSLSCTLPKKSMLTNNPFLLQHLKQHVYRFRSVVCVAGTSMNCMLGSLLYADGSRSRQIHYWIFVCLAAVGTARGGGQMKDDCAAAGVRWRGRQFISWLYVFIWMLLRGSKDGTEIPPRQSPSLLTQDVCQAALIKRQQHSWLTLVLELICCLLDGADIPSNNHAALFLNLSVSFRIHVNIKSCLSSCSFTRVHQDPLHIALFHPGLWLFPLWFPQNATLVYCESDHQ